MPSKPPLDVQLASCLKRLTAPCSHALRVLSETSRESPPYTRATLNSLRPAIRMLAECQNALSDVCREWNRLNTDTDDELRELILRQRSLTQELLATLQGAQIRLRNAQAALGPGLDDMAELARVRQAYRPGLASAASDSPG